MEKFIVTSCPTIELSYTNKAILHPAEKFAELGHLAVRYPKKNEAFVFTIIADPTVEKGKMAFNLSGRKWASLMLNSTIEAAPYQFDPQNQCLNSITFTTDFASRQNAPVNLDFDTEEMSKQFSQQFFNQAFTVGQFFGFAHQVTNRKVVLELRVKELEAVNVEKPESGALETASVEIGLTTANTIVIFERAEGSEIKLIGGRTGKIAAPKIFSNDWDFASMGIGGLSEQFNTIFRRAFASRLIPPQLAEHIKIEHVRGMLLYGPPGTGKTLIARQIGKMLLAREPKIVNGPEVLNKYVGESEANIRKLFQEAEEEQARVGIHSGLHMIIFDEIDAICKSRGNSASTSGVGDNVVNQLLSKIDGVDALNNVLLIGMTNRRDLIDEALLRPGRLEVQIEIGLPNKDGRLEIFRIHTSELSRENMLDPSIKLEELAELSKNYTGAEIKGLIKAATSLAISKIVKTDVKVEIDQKMFQDLKLTRDDFMLAMERDIKPALGASEDNLKHLVKPIIQWDPVISEIQRTFEKIINQVSTQDGIDRPYFVLLHGESNSGLTTLAASMAAGTRFPFIRVCQAGATSFETETFRVQYIKKLFVDAARSEFSCLVFDGLEDILDYSHIGPTYSKILRTGFRSSHDLKLTDGRRMLVICTCNSEQFLKDLSLRPIFKRIIQVPSLTRPEQVRNILVQLSDQGNQTFTKNQCDELVMALSSIQFKMGVKDLETLIENAAFDDPNQRVKMFLDGVRQGSCLVKASRFDQPFV